jgi:hypothetical protein
MSETDSIVPSLDGRVWLKSIRHPALNAVVTVSDYSDVETPARSAAFAISGRSLPVGVDELHLGRDHVLDLRTASQAADDHLTVMLRTAGVLFLHVPTAAVAGRDGNVLLPGSMYVLAGTPRKHRVGGVSATQVFSIPLTEVNPPGPAVVGTTLTVGGLAQIHGTVESVWAAYPSIRDLWDTIGSLDDLVVI